ncbi:ATP-binding cassette domain-containing protein [Cuniculiplasma sp. SKW4]|uniref:ATP-binding cassette domain-containing protein n=1 Tax=Cuniculiplasma sp. SKW4 TaxID=3400171 RepID=UPI003FD1FBD7
MRNRALRDISVGIDEVKCIAIFGNNGTGKITMMKIIRGIPERYDGEFTASSGCTFCSEKSIFFDFMNAGINLNYYYSGNSFEGYSKKFLQKLNHENMNLNVKVFLRVMWRKLDIARAILAKSKILLLNEPFKGFNPGVSSDLISIIREFNYLRFTPFSMVVILVSGTVYPEIIFKDLFNILGVTSILLPPDI